MTKPKIRKNTRTGDKGVRLVNCVVEDDLGWLFREQPKNDTGIDAFIEILNAEEVTGQLLALQIKAGKSFFDEENDVAFIFRSDIAHYNYWTEYSIPVILVLCDLESETCYWVYVTKEDAQIITEDKSWKIEVPKSNLLNEEAIPHLIDISQNVSEYQRKYQKLIEAKPLMTELDKGNSIILEAEEWINKISGFGNVKITIEDRKGEHIQQIFWTVLWGTKSYEQGFIRTFPWANVTIDEDYYEDQDYDDFLQSGEAIYDKEEDTYIYDDEWYEEYKERIPEGIRPYSENGEVAFYRLKLELNDLGEAFLLVENYIDA
ncbi:DUF4365 domain-containing protein [Paenibacillus sp. P13VS]|uniref:DUF4365 domain-containing protein n=1 Tax=Paenibacillus sp. P13VS TaxID=2697367 RepID=UPI00187B3643|nr:DUF4365 domain-containing protein [Paenibacillus sp. P13VS]MBE7682211.1 DUF4365 domain-containing protein [Paenibacillus sp. P13VS]